jgi:hypothetical protein
MTTTSSTTSKPSSLFITTNSTGATSISFLNGQLTTDQYLTHYWPISCGTMKDIIGFSHMSQGSLATFIEDRFGNVNSALALNGGWTQVPSGIYFNTPQFTISVWVYPQSLGICARAIDFAPNPGSCDNSIFIRLDGSCNTGVPALGIFNPTTVKRTDASQNLIQNKWQFLTGTFDGSLMSFYADGILIGTKLLTYTLPTIIRNANYIGKSCDSGNDYSSSYIDDLRFYNKSLTQMEIQEIMNQNSTCK